MLIENHTQCLAEVSEYCAYSDKPLIVLDQKNRVTWYNLLAWESIPCLKLGVKCCSICQNNPQIALSPQKEYKELGLVVHRLSSRS